MSRHGLSAPRSELTPLEALRSLVERRSPASGEDLPAPQPAARIGSAEEPAKVRFVEMTSFRELEPQHILELVISLLAAVHSKESEILLWIQGEGFGRRLRFRLGHVQAASSAADSFLKDVVEGFLFGTTVTRIPSTDADFDSARRALLSRTAGCLIAGVPSERLETPIETRLDEALEAMYRQEFDVLVRLSPLSAQHFLDNVEQQLAQIVNVARSLKSLEQSEENQISFATGWEESFRRSREQRRVTSDATSQSDRSESQPPTAQHIGAVLGGLCGVAVACLLPPAAPAIAATAVTGLGMAGGRFVAGNRPAKSSAHTKEQRSEDQAVDGRARTSERRESENLQDRKSTRMTLQLVGREAEQLEEVGNAHLDRVKKARSIGAFETLVLVAAKNKLQAQFVAHALVGALRGDSSHLEPMRVVPLAEAALRPSAEILLGGALPRWKGPFVGLTQGSVEPSTWLTAEEAAFWIRPPSRPIAGVSVRKSVRLGRSVPAVSPDGVEPKDLELGELLADGRAVAKVSIPVEHLTRHMFIAGTTGSGKTTTVTTLLERLQSSSSTPIPFMLVEPAKSEYRDFFDRLVESGRKPVRLVVGPPRSAHETSLCFNPFRPVPGIPAGRYVDQLKILLMSCFVMQESLPQLLEAVVYRAYERSKVSLLDDFPAGPAPRVPSFRKILGTDRSPAGSVIDEIFRELRYSQEVNSNFATALKVRMQSFDRGVKRTLFDADAVEDAQLASALERPCFVELSDISEPFVRRFVMGALLLRVCSLREASARASGKRKWPLRHLLVLEEAHHFLREPQGNAPGSDLVRQGNEMLTDALAEMRSYGQGIIIADQSPDELAPAVLRNTATKIAHGLYYEPDCRAMGDAMGIEPESRSELRRLRPGECIVSGPGYDMPVACKVKQHED